jgi:outer membrane protein assembly factor BamB
VKARHALSLAAAGTLGATILITLAGGTAASSKAPAASSTLAASWRWPGADPQNDRDVGGPINVSTVKRLHLVWRDPLTAQNPYSYGGYATTPVVSGGVLYTQDLDSNVQAIDLKSGKIVWTKLYLSPNEGPDGVTVADGLVFGATATSAFALEQSSGKQVWIKKLTRRAGEGIDMAPGFYNGTVYLATVGVNVAANVRYTGGGRGVLWALNAASGATKWKWDMVPANLWSSAHSKLNSGGGLWAPPTFDSEGNLYIGTANPAPFPGTAKYPWGSSRPGPNLYTDSIVKLNAQTGKLIWYYQLTPHDLYDRDMQNSPILATAHGRQLVIDGGKAGIVVALNAQTGKLVWKRSVGQHDLHDNDNLLALKGETSKLTLPEEIMPGPLGGIEGALASNGTTLFAAANNLLGYVAAAGITVHAIDGSGDLVAINEASGKIEWDVQLPSSPYGGVTLANNVVFTTTYNGTVWGFDASTGKLIWYTMLPAATNTPVAVDGDTLLTGASIEGTATPAIESIDAFRLKPKA